MNILIVGAGAIGSLLGGSLLRAGHRVLFKDRAEVVKTLKTEGFYLTWPDGASQHFLPEAIDNPEALEKGLMLDLVIVTVKSFDTEAAVSDLRGKLAPQTRLLSPQNGVGNEEVLQALFPEQAILAGSVTLPVAVPKTGAVMVTKNKGGLGLAPVSAGVEVVDVVGALRQSGFRVAVYENYKSLKWSKLLMNTVCNAIPAILDMPPGPAVANAPIFDLEIDSMREIFAVMRALEIPPVALPSYPVPLLEKVLTWLPNAALRPLLRAVLVGSRGDKLPSLLIDMRKARTQSEVNVLNKVAALYGQKMGINTPINEAVSRLLNEIIQGKTDWAAYRNNPAALCEYINQPGR